MDLIFNSTQTPSQSFVRKTDIFLYISTLDVRLESPYFLSLTLELFFSDIPLLKAIVTALRDSICSGTSAGDCVVLQHVTYVTTYTSKI